MRNCRECEALKKELLALGASNLQLAEEIGRLRAELQEESDAAWEIIGDVRVKLVEIEAPADYPMPLFDRRRNGRKAV